MRENLNIVNQYIHKTFHPDSDLDFIKENMRKVNKEGMAISANEAGMLQFLIRSLNIKNIVEIGCFLGYSAIQMARALPKDGKLITIEFNEAYYKMACEHIKQVGLENKIEVRLGEAMDCLQTIDLQVDMVFIDANKSSYSDYLDWAEKNVKKGGYIFGDNSLLFGNVVFDEKPKEETQKRWQAMRDFNTRLSDKQRYNSTLIPTAEGLTVAQKLF